MEGIKKYIISVVAVAIICSVVKTLIDHKSGSGAVIKLILGLLLSVTMVGPITDIRFGDISDYINDFTCSSEAAVDIGLTYAAENTAVIIKQQTEAYILDKAQMLGAYIDAEVILSSKDNLQKPCYVRISGDMSPYAKERLANIIAQDLGISEENQEWS